MADPSFVSKERLSNFTVHPTDPQSLSLRVSPGVIIVSDGDPTTGIADSSNYGSIRVDTTFNTVGPFVAPVGVGDYRYDLIVIDNLSNFQVVSGPEVNHIPTLTGEAPVIAQNMIPLAMILLHSSTTFLDPSNIIDIRPLLRATQDRSRTYNIDSVNPGAVAPSINTTGNFDRINWIQTSNNPSIRWALTVPEDLDNSRNMVLKIRGYSNAAASDTFRFRLIVQRVAATGGVFPPVAAPVWIHYDLSATGDNTNVELWQIPIMDASGVNYFDVAGLGGITLMPGDMLSFSLQRRGLDPADLFNGTVYTVGLSLDYNVGHSEYAS